MDHINKPDMIRSYRTCSISNTLLPLKQRIGLHISKGLLIKQKMIIIGVQEQLRCGMWAMRHSEVLNLRLHVGHDGSSVALELCRNLHGCAHKSPTRIWDLCVCLG